MDILDITTKQVTEALKKSGYYEDVDTALLWKKRADGTTVHKCFTIDGDTEEPRDFFVYIDKDGRGEY